MINTFSLPTVLMRGQRKKISYAVDFLSKAFFYSSAVKNAVALLLLPSKTRLKRSVIGDRFISFRASSNTSALPFIFSLRKKGAENASVRLLLELKNEVV